MRVRVRVRVRVQGVAPSPVQLRVVEMVGTLLALGGCVGPQREAVHAVLLGGKKRRSHAIGGIHPQRTHQLRGELLVSTPPTLASAAYLPLIMSAAYLPLSMSARLAEGDVGTPRVARAERVLVDLLEIGLGLGLGLG